VKVSIAIASVFLCVAVASRAGASPVYYGLTDLGTSDTLLKDANGTIYGVTNAVGTKTYTFQKTPVEVSIGPQVETWTDRERFTWVTTFVTQGGTYTTTTVHDIGGDYRTVTNGILYGLVNDVNIHGQMVGSAALGLGVIGVPGASNPEGVPSYAIPLPYNNSNFLLESGATIDDLGRILAKGNNGDIYLLTPNQLGSPQTVPEPSAFAMMIVAIIIFKFKNLSNHYSL
jgi:hypothetical protein